MCLDLLCFYAKIRGGILLLRKQALFERRLERSCCLYINLALKDNMASGGRGSDRAPQFTESYYEIPSWQIPWNKPWYQWNSKTSNPTTSTKTTTQFQYNSRGHLIDCNCTDCEDDLETAFAPQANTKEFNIPKDRHQEIDVELLENLATARCEERSQNRKPSSQSKSETLASNGAKAGSENVILLSDLPEYVPKTTNSCAQTTAIASSTSTTSANASFGSFGTSNFMSHESVIGSFDGLRAIQGISDQTRDIQSRVQNFKGNKDSKDYVAMRDLLVSLQRELGRINDNGFEWLHRAKRMAIEAVGRTLQVLEQKVKDSES